MGADIWIYTKKEPNFENIDPEIITQENYKVYYYRDPYNPFNLAWVVDLSYWLDFEKNPVEFLTKLSQIKDKQIEKYAKTKFKKYLEEFYNIHEKNKIEEKIQEFISWAKIKRDYLKKLIEAGIENVEYSI